METKYIVYLIITLLVMLVPYLWLLIDVVMYYRKLKKFSRHLNDCDKKCCEAKVYVQEIYKDTKF